MPEGAAVTADQPTGQRPGALLDERFGNIAVLDEELLLATCVYLI